MRLVLGGACHFWPPPPRGRRSQPHHTPTHHPPTNFSSSPRTQIQLKTSTNSAKDAEWVISGASYGNGTYKASTTIAVHETHAVHGPFQMFNKVNGGLDTKTTTTNTSGEWTIELPSSIVLYKYSLHHGNAVSTSANYPKDWTIEGSNDGTTWVTLDTRSNETYASSVTGFDVSKREYTVSNNTTKYKHKHFYSTPLLKVQGHIIGMQPAEGYKCLHTHSSLDIYTFV